MQEKLENRNILLNLSYDGSRYHGWQIQKNALSVQEVFQKALYKIIKEKTDIKGCSRTDSFVHANMYCVNFNTSNLIKPQNLIYALNSVLPDDIAVNGALEVPLDFNARYSCLEKEYIYKIWNNKIKNPFLANYALHYWYNIDVNLLNESTKYFLGKHDFTSFATLDKRDTRNMVRNIKKFEIYKEGDMVNIKISADGFLYNMVRIIVGTLLRICQGKIKKEDISQVINLKDRKYAGPTAPACGLYLNRVVYDNINF